MGKVKSRGNGQGTAYKRKGCSTWTASVVIGWRTPEDDTKKPIPIKRTKAGFKTKKDALAYCPTLLAGGQDPNKAAPRLSEYWETYKNGEFTKLSKNKQYAYNAAWKKLKPIQDIRVDRITVDLLRKTVSDNCRTYDPAKDCKNVLSNLFRFAAADRFADKDLPSFIVLPNHEEKERQPFNEMEQASLWKLYESGDKRAALPLLMIYTGMMPGEAMKLNVENIDLKNRTITHVGMKTKVRKATPIVIANAIVPLVNDLIQNAKPNGNIFIRRKVDWYADYYGALEAAGCRKLSPYSCRHTTATALAITEGIAPQTICRVMRWSTTEMLDRYAHPQMTDALEAVDQLKKASKSEPQI